MARTFRESYTVLIIFFLILQLPGFIYAQSAGDLDKESLTYIRNGFYRSLESHAETNRMIQFIDSLYSYPHLRDNPVLLSYYGVLETLKAKHVFNPFSKLSYLRRGLKKLDEAVAASPGNLEIRFLRFSVLHNIPSFLGMSGSLNQDADAIYDLFVNKSIYEEIDREMALNIMEFVLESKRLTLTQQDRMETLAHKIKYESEEPLH